MRSLPYLLIFLLFSCSSPERSRKLAGGEITVEIDDNSTVEQMIAALKQRREEVYSWLLLCDGDYQGQASQFPNECKQTDMLEFAGAACLSAQLAGDQRIVRERCRDVSLGQDQNGRFWRGQSNINQTSENSFSRDMLFGVINYFLSQGHYSKDPRANLKARSQALNWIDWIEYHGDGERMCNDDVGFGNNRCSIRGSRVLYNVFKLIGAINSSNQHYKTIKKLKKSNGLKGWDLETIGTPPGFSLYLKSHKNYQSYLMGIFNAKEYTKVAKIIYNKNPLNPWYEFMYLGPTNRNIMRTLRLCPKNRPTQDDWTVPHWTKGDFAWQRRTSERAWEIADGHDCTALINWQIAVLEEKISLPFKKPENSCGKKKELGSIKSKKICMPKLFNNITKVKCIAENGFEWNSNSQRYCLEDKGKYYLAKKIRKDCPNGHELVGTFKNSPLCYKNYLSKIKHYKCIRSSDGVMHGPASEAIKENGIFKWCHVYKDNWWQKRIIGKACPALHGFTGNYQWGKYPICKGVTKIKKSNCTGNGRIANEDHCLVRKNGWFNKRKYKKPCPINRKDTGLTYQGKALCKPIPHFKIKKKKCDDKDGYQLNNNWCIWDKGDHYKARKLK